MQHWVEDEHRRLGVYCVLRDTDTLQCLWHGASQGDEWSAQCPHQLPVPGDWGGGYQERQRRGEGSRVYLMEW